MFKKKQQLTRLGDVLVDKGIISKAQLDIAIYEQSRRKKLLDPADTAAKVAPIGEILIELGFIDRLQLKRGLNWQQRLRHVSIAMALCAPFMMFVPSAARAAPAPAATTIEAENYSTMSGVIKENTADVGGGQSLGAIATGDWMTYNNINIAAAGVYKITYRVSSRNGGAVLALRNAADTSLGSVEIPKTGSWTSWIEVEQTVTLPQGAQSLKIFAEAGGVNINWFKIEQVVPAVVAPAPISIVIQSEDYSEMKGVVTEDTTDEGGGKNVGGIVANDSMSYANSPVNIPVTGKYKISYRVANRNATANLELNDMNTGALVDTLAIPQTGGWQKWVTIEREVTLTKGEYKFAMLANLGSFNINWFKIETVTDGGSGAASSSSSSVAPAFISTVIQSEDYSEMKGIIAENTTDEGGGKNLGAIGTNDTMSYANSPVNIPVAGTYKVSYRVASPNATASVALTDINTGALVDTLAIPQTGGWQKWVTIEREVTLNKGEYKFAMLAKVGGFNINWFKVETVTGAGGGPISSSSAPAVSSSSSSSAPAVSSSSSSKSSTPVMSSSSSAGWSSSSAAAHVAGPVSISWAAPTKRENGADLYIDELGGYEIRYKKTGDTKYTYVSITDPWTQAYKFDWLEGDYAFQIAAFDKDGVYSAFEDIHRQ